ncbi:MAG: flagellar hook basal-body protein [Candidatus Gastranaerophilales bacterium]|nr:flagellar hook basal-body protein [Candidatus Gastranaerophilales bacterium]
MNNLQGIIRKSINNTTTQFDRLGYIANNLANYSTNGYKNVRFEQMLNENGYLTGAVRTDYSQGSIQITSNPYDIAINGDGFIPVVSPNGEVQYTRDGSFKISKDGYLTTNDDWIVGEGIKIPSNSYKITIKPDGKVVSLGYDRKTETMLGTIPIVQFTNPEGLAQADNNKLKATEESGDAALVKDHNYIAQYAVECSNTNIYGSVSDMLRLNASMIASLRMAKIIDDMYGKSINLRES